MNLECPISRKIAQAARARFTHYGYCKTTMSEIAQDCNMSPGNIYRYFKAKLDIAEEIAAEHAEQRLDESRKIIRNPSLGAVDRLKTFLFDSLRQTYAVLAEDEKMFEVAQILSQERPEFAEKQLEKERALIAEIIAAGNSQGEFNVADVVSAAGAIQSATMKYRYSQLHSHLSLDKLEAELGDVITLLLSGLQCRATGTSRPTV